jgi:hypothetical protein
LSRSLKSRPCSKGKANGSKRVKKRSKNQKSIFSKKDARIFSNLEKNFSF